MASVDLPRYTGGTEGCVAVIEAATNVVMDLEDSATRIALMEIVHSKEFVCVLYPAFRTIAQKYKGAELEKRLRECFYSRLSYHSMEIPKYNKYSLCGLTWYRKQSTGRESQVCWSRI